LVITDTPGRRDVLHKWITTNKALIRFNGTGNQKVDEERLLCWLENFQVMQDNGVIEIFLMIHQTNPLEAVKNIKFIVEENEGSDALGIPKAKQPPQQARISF
jgi:hypothetical protein